MSYHGSLPASIDATAYGGTAAPASVGDSVLKHALDLYRAGYAALPATAQPCRVVRRPKGSGTAAEVVLGGKRSIGQWKRFADEAALRSHFRWARNDTAGRGVDMPDGETVTAGLMTDGLCVLDVDSAKSPEVRAATEPRLRANAHRVAMRRILRELIARAGCVDQDAVLNALMAAPFVLTPSGGLHIYLRNDSGGKVATATAVLGIAHLDVRGDGGFCVAPGATLANGKRYIAGQRSAAKVLALKRWPAVDELPALPEELATALAPRRTNVQANSGATGGISASAASGSGIASNGLLALDDFLPGDAAKIARALAYTPADNYTYWFAVRMALWRRVENEPADRREGCGPVAFEVFAAWSTTTTGNNFTREACEAEWSKGPETTAGGITAASIVDRASRDRGDGKLRRAADGRRMAMIGALQQAVADADARGDARLAVDLNAVLAKLEGQNAAVVLTSAGAVAAAPSAPIAAALNTTTAATPSAPTATATSTMSAATPRNRRFPGGVVLNAAGAPVAFPVPRHKAELRNGLVAWADLATENGVPKPTFDNLKAALAGWGFTVRHDEFTDRLLIDGCSEFGVINDAAENAMRIGLEIAGCKIKPDVFRAYLKEIGRQNRVHVVRDYLDGLRWDGVPRVDRFWSMYFSVADTPLHRAFAKCWLIAAVRRVRAPGSKFDFMPVLESEEGHSKSRAFAELAGAEWFTDSARLGDDDKKMIEATVGKWIIEVAELEGMSKASVTTIKSQLSRQEDRARLAWGHYRTDAPRSFVVVGSTNQGEYLHSTTGNRRFWPMTCGKVDWQAVRRDRDQLWAEAAYREAGGESIELDPALWAVAAKAQEARRVTSADEERLLDLVAGLDGRIRKPDLYEALGYGNGRAVPRGVKEVVTKIMREAGWVEKPTKYPGSNSPTRAWTKGVSGGWQLLDPHRKVFVPLAMSP